MRRLPVFLLIDVSESMVGKPLQNVNEGIRQIISNLRSNPMALETAYLSLIVFAGKAQTIVPLTEVLKFNYPDLPIGGGTSLGAALNHLMNEIDANVRKTTSEKKGDWRPVIFLLTDGIPTDDYFASFAKWNQEYRKKSTLICVGMGDQVDLGLLKKISDSVFLFTSTEPDSYKKFFQWISASIESRSTHVGIADSQTEKIAIPDKYLKEINESNKRNSIIADKVLVLIARCELNKTPYLVKYNKISGDSYGLEGVYIINEEYFNLTLDSNDEKEVNTRAISQFPQCPVCGSQNFAYCSCGKLYCFSNAELTICPWCGKKAKVTFTDSFNIKKTRG